MSNPGPTLLNTLAKFKTGEWPAIVYIVMNADCIDDVPEATRMAVIDELFDSIPCGEDVPEAACVALSDAVDFLSLE